MDRGISPEPLEHVVEERIAVPVVQRHVGRRPHDDEHALAIDPEIVEHGRVRSEPVEVVLLLQPGIATHFRRTRAEAVEALLRDGLGNDDARRRAAAEPVLCRARTRSRRRTTTGLRASARPSAARARRARARCRTCCRARVAPQRAEPTCHRARLPGGARASVSRPDDLVLDAVEREELRRLCVLPRRHAHLVAAIAEKRRSAGGRTAPVASSRRRSRRARPDPSFSRIRFAYGHAPTRGVLRGRRAS